MPCLGQEMLECPLAILWQGPGQLPDVVLRGLAEVRLPVGPISE